MHCNTKKNKFEMSKPGEKLAQSLKILKKFQDKGFTAVKTSELSRVHKERLVKNGFLKEVVKGWYIISPSNEHRGDSTSWYASYWHFCARYLTARYKKSYCISAEQSLLIHAGNWSVPHQLIIRSTKGANKITKLPYGTSLFPMQTSLPKEAEIFEKEGIRMLTLPSSLIHCSPKIFTSNPIDVRTALAALKDAADISRMLLEGGHSVVAGRLAGAFRNIGQKKTADSIVKNMKSAGYDIRELDPFGHKTPVKLPARETSPYANRIRLMWTEMRKTVIQNFPNAPGIPKEYKKYMKLVEELYVTDAYNSLSIERYRVTPELIEHVRSGKWNLDNEEDRKHRDTMAARGYWQATQKVRESIKKVLSKQNAGNVADEDHGEWYRELFASSVTAGLLKPSDLAGYRNDQVYISNSKHVPPNKDAVRNIMPVLFDLLRNEPEASVRAVMGHFIFVFIHPYMDGNGRMGRFLMNVMLASGGFP